MLPALTPRCFALAVVQPLYATLLTIVPLLADVAERIETNRECWASVLHTATMRRRSMDRDLQRRSLDVRQSVDARH